MTFEKFKTLKQSGVLTEIDHERFKKHGYKMYWNIKEEENAGLFDPYRGDIILEKIDGSEILVHEGGLETPSSSGEDFIKIYPERPC